MLWAAAGTSRNQRDAVARSGMPIPRLCTATDERKGVCQTDVYQTGVNQKDVYQTGVNQTGVHHAGRVQHCLEAE